jgi:hypothetical protein
MANNKPSKFPKFKKSNAFKRFPFGWIIAMIIFYLLISSVNISITGVPKEIPYSEFYGVLKDSPQKIKSLTKI